MRRKKNRKEKKKKTQRNNRELKMLRLKTRHDDDGIWDPTVSSSSISQNINDRWSETPNRTGGGEKNQGIFRFLLQICLSKLFFLVFVWEIGILNQQMTQKKLKLKLRVFAFFLFLSLFDDTIKLYNNS